MHSKRFGVGVAVVNRLLYAIGGFDGNDRLASMECYHPENNAWTVLPSMKLGRSGAGVAALNQFIYVVGGFDGQNHLSSVERFDTDKQTWEMVGDIRTPRSALSLTVLDGKLYAMGGFDGQVFLTNVEVYDPARNDWEDGTPLTSGRSGHASAVIYQPAVPSGSSSQETVSVLQKKSPNGLNLDDEPMTTEQEERAPRTGSRTGTSGGVFMGEVHPDTVYRSTAIEVVTAGDGEQRCRPPLGIALCAAKKAVDQVNGSHASEKGANPFKNHLLDLHVLRGKSDSGNAAEASTTGAEGGGGGGGGGICSYFSANGLNSGRPPPLQVVDINTLLSEPGPSSRSTTPGVHSHTISASPPIRIAKKREAESPNIPCTPPHDGEIKIRPAEDKVQSFSSSGVKTFLPVVDFQNQRKYHRRKINPAPVRHPSYASPRGAGDGAPAAEPGQEVGERMAENVVPVVPVAVPLMRHCATMNKIKEAVRQTLFSPSILGASAMKMNGYAGGSGSSNSSYQEKSKTSRTNLVKSRRKDGGGGGAGGEDESSESDNYQMEEDGR